MPQPSIVIELAKTRTFRVSVVLHFLVGTFMLGFPLFAVMGFERALASSLLASVTTPLLASTAFDLQLRSRESEPLKWWGATILWSLLLLIPSWLIGLVYEALTQSCDYQLGSEFMILLGGGNIVVTSVISMVFAYGSPARLRRPIVTVVLTYALIACWLFLGLWRLYEEPQIFTYISPLGYWPGSIYDEGLSVSPSLWAFRAYGLLASLGIAFGIRSVIHPPHWTFAARRPHPLFVLLSTMSLTLGSWTYMTGGARSFRLNRAAIQKELSLKVETEHFILHADPSITLKKLKQLAQEHEFRFDQLSHYFGTKPNATIRSFIYRSGQQKGQLMGAYNTQIARPWHLEIHIDGASIPHRVLKHELAHVFASRLATGFLKVPTWWGIVPNIGLIEGIAVAADNPVNELTLHEWAAAMLKLQRLPNLSKSLDPAGFWSISSSRAYTATGSFVAWLVKQYGISRFAQLYAGESFEAAYQRSAASLEADWRTALKSIPLDPAALRMAEHRFSRPSIFEKVCARTSANFESTLFQHIRSGNLSEAHTLVTKILDFRPSEPRFLVMLAWAYLRQENFAEAQAVAQRAVELEGATEKARAQALEILGHLAWADSNFDLARNYFSEVLGLQLSSPSLRLQTARLAALDRSPSIRSVLRAYFEGRLTHGRDLLSLSSLAQDNESDPLINYLFARRLEHAQAGKQAITYLNQTDALPSASLQDEARLMKARIAWMVGDYPLAAVLFEEAASKTHRQSIRATAKDWGERVQHTQTWE